MVLSLWMYLLDVPHFWSRTIKKFKLNNPNKPIPEDLLQVQRINTNQLIAYNKQLNNRQRSSRGATSIPDFR